MIMDEALVVKMRVAYRDMKLRVEELERRVQALELYIDTIVKAKAEFEAVKTLLIDLRSKDAYDVHASMNPLSQKDVEPVEPILQDGKKPWDKWEVL